MTQTRTRTRLKPIGAAGLTVAAAVVVASTTLFGVAPALADDGPSVPPGTEATSVPPVELDPKDPDLKMPEGARSRRPRCSTSSR